MKRARALLAWTHDVLTALGRRTWAEVKSAISGAGKPRPTTATRLLGQRQAIPPTSTVDVWM
jgi:hypothetical protein